MPDEIIDAEFEAPARQTSEGRGIAIIPGAIQDSLVSGFKEGASRSEIPFLFVGGPLDGKIRRVHADGRQFYYRKCDDHEEHDMDELGVAFIYVPAVIRLKSRATAVYLFEDRIKQSEDVAERNAIAEEERQRKAIEDQGRRIENGFVARRFLNGQ